MWNATMYHTRYTGVLYLLRIDRVGKVGGGVGIYVRADITSKILYCSKGELTRPEFLFVEILINCTKILLCTVYRASKISDMSEFETVLFEISPMYDNIVIGGDFNTNLLLSSARKTQLLNMFNYCNMSVLPLQPTYQHNLDFNASLLDLFFVNNLDKVLNYGQFSHAAISKHDIIFLSYSIKDN
jgi:hypothetical protein